MPKCRKVWYLMRKFVSGLWETKNCITSSFVFWLVAATYENWSPPVVHPMSGGWKHCRGTPWILVSDPKTHPSNKVTSKRIFKQSFFNEGYKWGLSVCLQTSTKFQKRNFFQITFWIQIQMLALWRYVWKLLANSQWTLTSVKYLNTGGGYNKITVKMAKLCSG